MTVIAQDDHLTAGARAACDPISIFELHYPHSHSFLKPYKLRSCFSEKKKNAENSEEQSYYPVSIKTALLRDVIDTRCIGDS